MQAKYPLGGKTRPVPASFSPIYKHDFDEWRKGTDLQYYWRTFDFYKAWREKQSERINLSHEEIELDRIREVGRVVELLRKEKIGQDREKAKKDRKTYGGGRDGHYYLTKPTFKKPQIGENNKSKLRSIKAEQVAIKRANRTKKEHEDDKEAHKLAMRERRKNKCPSEKQRKASAERTAKYRNRMSS